MIAHLQGREKALELFGWTGRKAEWIALACMHGEGVFIREQLAFHLRMSRWQALRFVQAVTRQGLAYEHKFEERKVCRIFSRGIYRALGAEDIRRRPLASTETLLRHLLSPDYVLEHTGLGWLPTEAEKVRAFEALGIERRHLPLRVYRGAVGESRRHFQLKLAFEFMVLTAARLRPVGAVLAEPAEYRVDHGLVLRGPVLVYPILQRGSFHASCGRTLASGPQADRHDYKTLPTVLPTRPRHRTHQPP